MNDAATNIVSQRRGRSRDLRGRYQVRLGFRIAVLALMALLYFLAPKSFDALQGMAFFQRLSWLHLLWLYWMVDIVQHLIPKHPALALGSLKQFPHFYRPVKGSRPHADLRRIVRKGRVDLAKVLVVWALSIAGFGFLWGVGILKEKELLLATAAIFVLDLAFVLYWCPFRSWILKTRCCTTCRIFNWGHLMLFTPLLFIPGFFSISLFGASAVVFLVWEVRVLLHPERFFEETNATLHCANCADPLCTPPAKRG